MIRSNKKFTVLAMLGLLALSAPVHAGLKAFSSAPALLNGVPVGGIPSWYQDQNGVAVQPCLDVASCGLAAAGEPGVFDPSLPISFPTNFPSEAFYFDSVSNNFLVGGADVFVLNAMEFTFINPVTGALTVPQTPGALGAPFMRLRLSVKPPAGGSIAAGIWTIQHPWGTTTFDSNIDCRTLTATCRMTRDLPAVGAIPPNFVGALGAGVPDSISTFLKSVLPAPPPGFLGNAAAAVTVAGGTVRNSVSVTDPAGNTGSTSAFQLITGQMYGMEVAPATNDFGALVVGSPAGAPVTVTVTNINTVSSLTLGAVALTGADAADFAISADTCSNVTIPPAAAAPAPPSTCTFAVSFTPVSLAPAPEHAARNASVSIPGTFSAVPPATAGDPAPPGIFAATGTAQYTVALLPDASGGAISVAPSNTPSTGTVAVNAATPQDFKIIPNPRFQVRDITLTPAGGAPQLQTFTKAANPAQPVIYTLPGLNASGSTLGATFMPSGNITGSGTIGVADALAALRIVVGLKVATPVELAAMDVFPLGIDGRPAPDNQQNLSDAITILRRAVGLVTW